MLSNHNFQNHQNEWGIRMINRRQPPVDTITRKQYFDQLAKQGIVTQQEADSALNGKLPNSMMSILDTIENITSRYSANQMLSTGESFYRNQPILYYIGNGYGMTEEQTDQLFDDALSL